MSRRGLITGVPGWLTGRFLQALRTTPGDGSRPAWAEALAAVRWRALCLPATAPADLPPAVDEVVTGDVRNPETARRALRGADLVVHAAGLIHPRRIRDLYEVNGQACGVLAQAAVEAGTERFVFVSSNAAAGFSPGPEQPLREADPPRPASHYGRSKLAGEEALWENLVPGDTCGVVLRPTTFYGPGFPRRHLRAYRLAASGRPLVIGDGRNRVSMIYVDDLVDALGRALTAPAAAGQTFFVADAQPYPWLEIFTAMGRAQGVTVRPRALPGALATLCAAADRLLGTCGCYAMMVHVAGEATRHMACDITRARRDLGFAPAVGLYEGMRRAVAWARAEGLL